MGSRVRVEAPGQAPRRPEGTAVAQVRKVAEGPKRATRVVAGGKRVLWADPAREEASVLPAFRARRAAVLLPGVVGHPAAVEEPPVAVAVVVVVEGAVVDKEKEK